MLVFGAATVETLRRVAFREEVDTEDAIRRGRQARGSNWEEGIRSELAMVSESRQAGRDWDIIRNGQGLIAAVSRFISETHARMSRDPVASGHWPVRKLR